MFLQCDVKGCRKENESLLDTASNDVYCGECGEVMNNQSEFVKKTLKSLGQIKRSTGKQQAYSVKCAACNREGAPDVNSKRQLVCRGCKVVMTHIAKPFEQLILTALKNSTNS